MQLNSTETKKTRAERERNEKEQQQNKKLTKNIEKNDFHGGNLVEIACMAFIKS